MNITDELIHATLTQEGDVLLPRGTVKNVTAALIGAELAIQKALGITDGLDGQTWAALEIALARIRKEG